MGQIKSIRNKTYIIKNNSERNLINLGFRLKKDVEEEYKIYSYKFPIMQYEDIVTLYGEITVFTDSKIVKLAVYNGIGDIYTRFYNDEECGNADPILDWINQRFLHEFKKINITEKKRSDYVRRNINK